MKITVALNQVRLALGAALPFIDDPDSAQILLQDTAADKIEQEPCPGPILAAILDACRARDVPLTSGTTVGSIAGMVQLLGTPPLVTGAELDGLSKAAVGVASALGVPMVPLMPNTRRIVSVMRLVAEAERVLACPAPPPAVSVTHVMPVDLVVQKLQEIRNALNLPPTAPYPHSRDAAMTMFHEILRVALQREDSHIKAYAALEVQRNSALGAMRDELNEANEKIEGLNRLKNEFVDLEADVEKLNEDIDARNALIVHLILGERK